MAWVLPPTGTDADPGEDEVPDWIHRSPMLVRDEFADRWAPDPLPPIPDWMWPDTTKPGMPRRPQAQVEGDWRRHCARTTHRAAVEAWCKEHGYSYRMTVLGHRRPSSSDQAAGHVCVPRRTE